MQMDYNNSIRNMIFSNENLKDMLFNNSEIDDYSNKIVNLELFFLAFKIFEDDFKKLDIYDSWKELFIKQDYIIDGDKILFGDKEISYQLIEITFINLMIEYRNKIKGKIIEFPSMKKTINKEYMLSNEDNLISFGNIEDTDDEVRSKLDKYIVDKSEDTKKFLDSTSVYFKNMVYDGIINVYNRLKENRTNRMFKTNLLQISEDNKYLNDLMMFLLNLYPIHYYAKDKVFIRYDYIKMHHILVDPNHFKFDDAWEMLTNRLDILSKKIDLLTNAKSISRGRNKRKYQFLLNNAIMDRERVLEQILDISEVSEEEEFNGDSFYSGELLNKHIIYNLELAINKGYVDFRKNKQDKDELVLYAINGNEVDFIMHIELDKLYMAIDDMNVIDLFKSDNGIRKVLS